MRKSGKESRKSSEWRDRNRAEWRQFGTIMVVLGVVMYELPLMMTWLHLALGGLYDWLQFGIGTVKASITGATPAV